MSLNMQWLVNVYIGQVSYIVILPKFVENVKYVFAKLSIQLIN